MESDDDYQSFSPQHEPSPPLHHRRLKRLKKSVDVSNEGVSLPPVDSSDDVRFDGVREETERILDFGDVAGELDGERSDPSGGVEEDVEDLRMEERSEKKGLDGEDSNESEGFDGDDELNSGSDDVRFGEERRETKRSLEFSMDGEFDGERSDQGGGVDENVADLKGDRSERKRLNEEGSIGNNEMKKKKKRGESDGDEAKPKTNRRREEKERRNYLQELHAESQRLLRETRDATFKPVPVVQKPISSVLEKIRQRKIELLKKTSLQNKLSIAENNGTLSEDIMDHDSENVSTEEREVDKFVEVMQEETIACHADVESGFDSPHVGGSKEATRQSSHENTPPQKSVDEKSMHAFRAPVDDTQDLFGDSQTSEGTDPTYDGQNNSPLEEVLAPSLLAMNLKFDSAPPDEISDDEEDNDKENIVPDPDTTDNGCYSPRGDPVKAFVDDEAVEEDDSDNDLLRFQENEEDEDNDDYEELKDLIATGYDEKPIDNERRNELHQKWLEQQDAAGTDNLLQRLKFGSKLKDTTLLEEDNEEEEEDNEDDEFGDEVADDNVKTSVARINSRKAKQMIPHLFSDKNDGYLSSDGEETERRLVKQRLLEKAEVQGTLLSPAKDESCREVFGLIKKLTIVPETKKKAKTSSFFDKILTGRSNNGSSKSSFLGRESSHSLPPSRKRGTSTVRSFIFGRDDSNSRNSISMSEDSSDAVPIEKRPARNTTTTKFSSSQSKLTTQNKKDAAEAVSGASLFEILNRSSMVSNACNHDTAVSLTEAVYAAFKIQKRTIKIEGKT